MRRIPPETLVNFGTALLKSKGLNEEDARYIAHCCVRTECFGVTTHGLRVLGHFDRDYGPDGEIRPDAKVKVVKQTPAAVVLDGRYCFGHVAMRETCSRAAELARNGGVGLAAVINTNWMAGAGVFAAELAEQGLLARIWVQWCVGGATVPHGGLDGRFSTNPMAIAFPTADGDPVMADFSTSSLSYGRSRKLADSGGTTPEPVYRNPDGTLSDDPQDMVDGDAAMLPTGGVNYGYKGMSLSLWQEALTAATGGAANNPEHREKPDGKQNVQVLAIDPQQLAGKEYFENEMSRLVRHVRTSRPVDAESPVRLPGERAFALERECLSQGVPVSDERLEQLNQIAENNNIPPLR
ncbi:MAG: Ldh family oxidoreductase [Phycisphaerae bacterium]